MIITYTVNTVHSRNNMTHPLESLGNIIQYFSLGNFFKTQQGGTKLNNYYGTSSSVQSGLCSATTTILSSRKTSIPNIAILTFMNRTNINIKHQRIILLRLHVCANVYLANSLLNYLFSYHLNISYSQYTLHAALP